MQDSQNRVSPTRLEYVYDVSDVMFRSFLFAGETYHTVSRADWGKLCENQSVGSQFKRAGSIVLDRTPYVLLKQCIHLTDGPNGPQKTLTGRELQIAYLIAEGKCDKIIGRELGISENTVREHLRRIFNKLHIAKRTSLVVHVLSVQGKR